MIGNQRQDRWGTGATGPSGDAARAPSRGRRRAVVPAVLLTLACGPGPGCQPAAPKAAAGSAPPPTAVAKPAGPSKVTGAVKEADLTKLELTEQAEQRL